MNTLLGSRPSRRSRGAGLLAGLAVAATSLVPLAGTAQATSAPPPRMLDAATWLAGEVPEGGLLPSPFGGDDQGLSIDAALALIALGTKQDVVDQIMAALAADTVAYTGFGNPEEKYAGATAKLLYALAAHGVDVTSVDGRNLRQDVLDLVTENGRVSDVSTFGNFANIFGQSFSVLGLTRTGGVPQVVVDYLLRQQCSDGGFRVAVDEEDQTCVEAAGSGAIDGTAIAVQALIAAQTGGSTVAAGVLEAAEGFLTAKQGTDGGLPTGGGNSNGTGLAGQAFAALGSQAKADLASDFVLTLQRTSGAEKGAIALDAEAFGDGAAVIPDEQRDQWRRATSQAALGLAQTPLGVLGTVPGAIPPAPSIGGQDKVFLPFGSTLSLTGTGVPGDRLLVMVDRRGPEGWKVGGAVTVTPEGFWVWQATPGDDYRIKVVGQGLESNTILLFTTPTIDSLPGQVTRPSFVQQYGPDNGAVVLRGRGAPGSSFLIWFRRLGTPEFSLAQRLTVGPDGRWQRPLALTVDWSYFVVRGADAPRSPVYVVTGR